MTAAIVVPDLTDAEAGALVECERTIERGLKTFVEVGQALARIRDEQLYRTDHATFEAYCDDRWGFTDDYARKMIRAVEATKTIVSAGLPAPTNEAQARELARVDEEQRAEVWREARDRTGGRPTAATVREVVRERQAPPPSTPADADVIMLRYSKVAGWIVGTPGAAPFATTGYDIPELDVKAAQLWAGDETLSVHGVEVIRWAESTDRAGAWVAVLADDAPATRPETPARRDPESTPDPAVATPGGPDPAPMPARQDVADAIVAGIDQHAASVLPDAATHVTPVQQVPVPAAEPERPAPPTHAEGDARRDAQLDAEMANTAARFRANFAAAIARADDLWQFDIDRIAELYAATYDTDLRPFLEEMTRWCERVSAACQQGRSGLRVINGGAR